MINHLEKQLNNYIDENSDQDQIVHENYIAILIASIENVFDYMASGQRGVGFSYRPPYFEPDYDPESYGGYGNSGGNHTEGEIVNNPDNYILSISQPILLQGNNSIESFLLEM